MTTTVWKRLVAWILILETFFWNGNHCVQIVSMCNNNFGLPSRSYSGGQTLKTLGVVEREGTRSNGPQWLHQASQTKKATRREHVINLLYEPPDRFKAGHASNTDRCTEIGPAATTTDPTSTAQNAGQSNSSRPVSMLPANQHAPSKWVKRTKANGVSTIRLHSDEMPAVSRRSMTKRSPQYGRGTYVKSSTNVMVTRTAATTSTPTTTSTTDSHDTQTDKVRSLSCDCAVSTNSTFSLRVRNTVKSDQLGTAKRGYLRVRHGCYSQHFDLTDVISGTLVFPSNDTEKVTQCLNISDVYHIQVICRNVHMFLSIKGTSELQVQCGDQTTKGPDNTQSPSFSIDVHRGGLVGVPADGKDSGADTSERPADKGRGHHPSRRQSRATVYLMCLVFVCIILVIVSIGLLLFWRRSLLGQQPSHTPSTKSANRSSTKHDDHNYEEISEVLESLAREPKISLKPGATEHRTNFNHQTSVDSKPSYRSANVHDCDGVNEANRLNIDKDYSEPNVTNRNVLAVEYSTAKDAVRINPRSKTPRGDVSSISTNFSHQDLVSYEDLPNACPLPPKRSFTDEQPPPVAQSAPELSREYSQNDYEYGNECEALTLASSASALLERNNDLVRPYSQEPLLSNYLVSNTYFELHRNYRSISLDASKLVIYDGVVGTNNRPWDVNSCSSDNGPSQGSKVTTCLELPTHIESHIYEDVEANDVRMAERPSTDSRMVEIEATNVRMTLGGTNDVSTDEEETIKEKNDETVRSRCKVDIPLTNVAPMGRNSANVNGPCIVGLSNHKRTISPNLSINKVPLKLKSSVSNSVDDLSQFLHQKGSEHQYDSAQADTSIGDGKLTTFSITHVSAIHGTVVADNDNDDDEVVMIANPIYQSSRSILSDVNVETNEKSFLIEGKGDNRNSPEISPQSAAIKTKDAVNDGVMMTGNSIYQSSRPDHVDVNKGASEMAMEKSLKGNDNDDIFYETSTQSPTITTNHDDNDSVVMIVNPIYQSSMPNPIDVKNSTHDEAYENKAMRNSYNEIYLEISTQSEIITTDDDENIARC